MRIVLVWELWNSGSRLFCFVYYIRGCQDYIQSHFAANIYSRSALGKASQDLLRDSEEHYAKELAETALPLTIEWFGHWAVRDQMQEALHAQVETTRNATRISWEITRIDTPAIPADPQQVYKAGSHEF